MLNVILTKRKQPYKKEKRKTFRKKQCDFNELLMNGWRTGEKHLYTVASLKTGDLLKD